MQYGFLPGRSTVLQSLNVLDPWPEAIDNGFYVDVIYCNFMKAFDKVPQKRLLKVLKYYCIPSKIVDWIESFLTNSKQRAIVNGTPSSWYDVISGVPQGSVLGPILFIYINTLIEVVKYSDLFLFADDNKLFKIIQTKQDSSLLQYDIDYKYNWMLNSFLLFQPKMCFIVHVNSKSTCSIIQTTYKMNDILESKLELKDLGAIIDNHLSAIPCKV